MPEDQSPSEIFKIRLKYARDELRHLSQSKLAEMTKLPPSSIAHFESGSRKPSFENLRRLANALEVTTDYLLGRVETPGMAESADPLFRDAWKLNDENRDIAKLMLEALAKRSEEKKGS